MRSITSRYIVDDRSQLLLRSVVEDSARGRKYLQSFMVHLGRRKGTDVWDALSDLREGYERLDDSLESRNSFD